MTQNCTFCQKETVYVPLIVKNKDGKATNRVFQVYYCYDCQAEYAYFGSIKNVHLYTTINNRMYRWSLELNGSMGRLWYVGEPGEPGVRPNRKLELVKNFQSMFPTITPQNIQDKLKFILLFL
jgi:hypothetical protein